MDVIQICDILPGSQRVSGKNRKMTVLYFSIGTVNHIVTIESLMLIHVSDTSQVPTEHNNNWNPRKFLNQ